MAGHLRTQRRRDLSSGGRSWTPEDTGGHATKAVRDREAPVSNSSSPWLYIQSEALQGVAVHSSFTGIPA